MRCAALFCAGALVWPAGGCAGASFGGVSAEDRALIEEAGSLLIGFSERATCADLMNEGPAGIAEKATDVTSQFVDPNDASHTFGNVPPDKDHAFFVLASSAPVPAPGESTELATLVGTMFAIGCRDFSAASGTRQDLPITLFAAGLR